MEQHYICIVMLSGLYILFFCFAKPFHRCYPYFLAIVIVVTKIAISYALFNGVMEFSSARRRLVKLRLLQFTQVPKGIINAQEWTKISHGVVCLKRRNEKVEIRVTTHRQITYQNKKCLSNKETTPWSNYMFLLNQQ